MSRLGRDYIDTGHYMERYFPEKGIRYITLLDNYDSESGNNDIVPFKALLNDMYAKDISKKIKATKHAKQEKGLFIGWKAPYGYMQSKENKNILVIDTQVADNVRLMFEMAEQGKSAREIATIFNADEIPTPASYKGVKLSEEHKGPYRGKWSSERIAAMLTNEVYIGNMVQRRMKKVSYKSKKCVRLPKEDWVIVKNTHDPIVDEETFKTVGRLLKSRYKTRQRTHDYLLKGLIRCDECDTALGVMMRKLSGNRDTLYFVCRTYQRFTQEDKCTCHCIRVESVTDAVVAKVKDICKQYVKLLNLDDITDELAQQILEQQKRQKNSLANIKASLKAIERKIDRVLNDSVLGSIEEEDFQRFYKRLKDEQSDLQSQLDAFDDSEVDNPFGKKEVEMLVKRFLDAETISRELLVAMVDKITLTESKTLHVHFNFKELELAEQMHEIA